jgi:cytochrome c oxidase subunit II
MREVAVMARWLAGPHDVLAPAGPQAGRLADLAWFLFAGGGVVYALVMIAVVVAVVRGRSRGDTASAPPEVDGGHNPPPPEKTRAQRRAVTAAVAVSAAVLVAVIAVSYLAGKAVATMPSPEPLTVKVVGRQWWWEFEYQDPVPSRTLRSPNELRIPVGRPVRLQITSVDVIHSFWVPNLHGKRDAIPGQTAVEWFQADQPGTWRGMCAEFCGYQHAHMAFTVVAEPPEAFEAWRDAQLLPAAEPSAPTQVRGRDVFLSHTCVMCHSIAGTPAYGRVGPDLTHVAGRGKLAAGTLDVTRENLARWVSDPQAIKPGVRMPPNPMRADDLDALLDYLESLK